MNERQSTDGKNIAMATERGPGDWRRLPFSEAVEINPRRAVARGTPAPFVDMASLPAETREVRPARTRPVGVGGSRFSNGDTLFARITPCTENGKTGLVSCLSEGEVATGSTEFIVLGPRPEVTLPEYVYYLAKSQALRSYAISRMTGTSGRQRVPTSVFDDYEVRIPPVTEQNKIAAILSSVDDSIEKTQAVIDQVQVIKGGVMRELLSRGLPGQHALFKKTEIGVVPSGWSIASLRSLSQINPEQLASGTDPDYLLEYLDIASIERPGLIGDSKKFRFADAPSRARRIVRRGDILVSTVRPYLRNFACVREANDNLVASTGYAVVRPGYGVDGRFLYQHTLSVGFVEYLKTRMTGSNYPAVTARDVGSYRLSLPPLAEQCKIAAVLSSMDDAIEKLCQSSDRMQIVKRGLLSVLLTGEVRVTADTEAA